MLGCHTKILHPIFSSLFLVFTGDWIMKWSIDYALCIIFFVNNDIHTWMCEVAPCLPLWFYLRGGCAVQCLSTDLASMGLGRVLK